MIFNFFKFKKINLKKKIEYNYYLKDNIDDIYSCIKTLKSTFNFCGPIFTKESFLVINFNIAIFLYHKFLIVMFVWWCIIMIILLQYHSSKHFIINP